MVDPTIREEMVLMIYGTIMMFVSAFGSAGLLILGIALLEGEAAHPLAGLLVPVLFALGVWNVYQAILLVIRPRRPRAVAVLVRALVAFVPLALAWG